MHINTVPARNGYQWLKLGFQMFWRQPLAWILLFVPLIACTMLLQCIPWLGPALSLALGPLLWLLTMLAAHQVFAGQRLRPAALLAAFDRDRLRAVLALGALYAVAAIAPLMLTTLIDGGELARFMLNMNFREREATALKQNMLLMLCWYAWLFALSPMLCFAPGLVHWHGIAPLRALGPSAVAYLRNWRAFVVLFLSSMGIMATLVVGALVIVFIPLFLLLTGVPQNAGMLLLIQGVGMAGFAAAVLVLVMAQWLSAAFSLRDCFSPPANPRQRPRPQA